MDSILQQITDWLKEMLVSGIMGNLSGNCLSCNRVVKDPLEVPDVRCD